ncbi:MULTISPECIES: HIRAN domain-containing protein [unclassified Microbacterium]|uniref:HIRAN domain-containing protein n=1 Tax=unclassified Microbacterium TaxID=2609290 RepID=UPI0038632552
MPTWFEQLIHAVTGRSSAHDSLPDLRDLPSERVAVERTYYLVNDRERRTQDDRLYVLRREPDSRRDPAAVAVYSNGRSVGYLSPAAAEPLAPYLDQLGGAAVVNGAGSERGSITLRVDVPTVDALRGYTAGATLCTAC